MSSSYEAWEVQQRQQELLEAIEQAVRLAEEMSWPPQPIYVGNRIRDVLIPALFDARTYIEVGQIAAPEIRDRLTAARMVAADLSQEDRGFDRLFSRLRAISEDADNAARLA
ncbi:MAG: hypothetical protein O3C10_12015 [Chloroflexi bacterium]|nr:hypothetical protein [Chloroflexota bacterium]